MTHRLTSGRDGTSNMEFSRMSSMMLQAPGSSPALQCLAGDRRQRRRLEDQLDIVQGKEFLVLLDERILRFGQDANDVGLIKVVHCDRDRKAADKLRDQAVLHQVHRLQLLEELSALLVAIPVRLRAEADLLLADAVLDQPLQAVEGPTADEEDVRGVDLDEVLVRVLAAALWRDVGNGALENLEQS